MNYSLVLIFFWKFYVSIKFLIDSLRIYKPLLNLFKNFTDWFRFDISSVNLGYCLFRAVFSFFWTLDKYLSISIISTWILLFHSSVMRKKGSDKKQELSAISQSDIFESHDSPKKLSKLKKILIDVFLISDVKNRKIRPELRSIKHEIVRNLDWNSINSDQINRFFWVYTTIWKSIYIPSHLEKQLPNYTVHITYDDKIREMNLKNYLIILKDIGSLFLYLQKLQSDIQHSINFDPTQQIFTAWENSIIIEQQETSHWLYAKSIASEIVEVQKKISTWSFDLMDIMKLYVFCLNQGTTKHFSFKRYLTQQHMQKEFIVGDITVTLKDFIRILKDLKIEDHPLK